MPWEVTQSLERGIANLRKMAEECIIHTEKVVDAEEAETIKLRIDSALWPNLSKHLNEIERKEFSGVALSASKDRGRETRGHSDFDDVSFLTTLQNRLQSLHTARVIENRTIRISRTPIQLSLQLTLLVVLICNLFTPEFNQVILPSTVTAIFTYRKS